MKLNEINAFELVSESYTKKRKNKEKTLQKAKHNLNFDCIVKNRY